MCIRHKFGRIKEVVTTENLLLKSTVTMETCLKCGGDRVIYRSHLHNGDKVHNDIEAFIGV